MTLPRAESMYGHLWWMQGVLLGCLGLSAEQNWDCGVAVDPP